MLSGNSAVIAETGDSWFNCQKLSLPENCGYLISLLTKLMHSDHIYETLFQLCKTIKKLLSIFRYEFQMQYGSIGWSVGATLGYAQAAKDKRVIACIGDGSFQVNHRLK